MIPAEELLQRISGSLRHTIGPAVGDDYPRTQAFMASVILEKTARQVQMASAHDAAAAADRSALAADLDALLAGGTASADVVAAATEPNLTALVDALYTHRTELGDDLFTALLNRVRVTLRADIDRRCEVAR